MMTVYSALIDEGMTGDVARQVQDRMTPDAAVAGLQMQVVDAARAMTEVQVPYDVQTRVFWRAFGIGIGGGGGAGMSYGAQPEPCPWCKGTGAHGGMCPGMWLGPRPVYPPEGP
jgi:hypothetical protein